MFSLRQTSGQPSHTVTHPLLSIRQHDFAVVMVTAAHRYLTDLLWDKVKKMTEELCKFSSLVMLQGSILV